MDIKNYAPFTDVTGFVRVALGVVAILFVLKVTGLRKYVA
jgi:hypothetical protein